MKRCTAAVDADGWIAHHLLFLTLRIEIDAVYPNRTDPHRLAGIIKKLPPWLVHRLLNLPPGWAEHLTMDAPVRKEIH